MSESNQSNQWQNTLQLSVTIGLGIGLLLVTLLSLRSNGTPSVSAAPTKQGGNNAVITIGVAARLYEDSDYRHVNAVSLAISQTNAAGGVMIGGTPYSVSMIVADYGQDGYRAITAANELISNDVLAVVGPMFTTDLSSTQHIYNTASIALISPGATLPNINSMGYTTTFRINPTEGAGAIKLAEYFYGIGLQRTALLCTPQSTLFEFPCIVADIYKNRYEQLGGTISSIRWITSTSDITPTMLAVQSEAPDAVVASFLDNGNNPWTGDDQVTGGVSRFIYTTGITATFGYIPFVIRNTYITIDAGVEAAEGNFVTASGRRGSDMPGWERFRTEYIAETFPHAPDPWLLYTPYAYDAANIIFDSIQRANTTDTIAIRNAIAATGEFSGAVGIYQGFDTEGEVLPQWGQIQVVENSQWVPALLEADFYSDQGGIFDLEDTWGQTTTIEIPVDTTTNTLSMVYELVATTTNVFTVISQHAVRVESNVSISSPMTVTIQYSDNEVVGVDESSLVLYTWDGSEWVDAQPCGGYVRDLDNNVLKAVICHFSDYILLEKAHDGVYLPIILK